MVEGKSVDILENLYNKFSRCKPAPVYKMAAQDAAFVKYGINSFLATKVMWFNQYKELIDSHGADYDNIITAVGTDPRISHSHTQVPGPDGRSGFGGRLFPQRHKCFIFIFWNRSPLYSKVSHCREQ